MSESDTTQKTPREADIIAPPPFGSGSAFDPKELLRVSRRRVWLGIVILIIGLAVGFSAPAFPTAKLWLGAIGLLLVIASFCILGLYRIRSGRGRDPRKLYAHQTHLTNR